MADNWIQQMLATNKRGPLPVVTKLPTELNPDKSTGPAKPVQLFPKIPVKKPPKKPNYRPVAKKPAKKKPAKKKPKNALEKWLAGDTTFQQQMAAFMKEKSDYDAQANRQKQIVGRDYSTTQRQMNKQAVDDRTQQANDFAGRGILHSGVYAKQLGDYNADFNTKLANLIQGRTDTLGNMNMDRVNFLRQLGLDQQAARQDAIRRRAQKLGL